MVMLKQGCRLLLMATVCLAWTLPIKAAELDKYLPSDTEFALTVNVRQIVDSELVKKYALDMVKGALQDNEAQKVLEALGFDPLKDVTSVAIASPGGDDREKGLVIVHGKFDTAKFAAKAEEVAKKDEHLKIIKAGAYTLYQVTGGLPGAGDKPTYVALVDGQTMVVSAG